MNGGSLCSALCAVQQSFDSVIILAAQQSRHVELRRLDSVAASQLIEPILSQLIESSLWLEKVASCSRKR